MSDFICDFCFQTKNINDLHITYQGTGLMFCGNNECHIKYMENLQRLRESNVNNISEEKKEEIKEEVKKEEVKKEEVKEEENNFICDNEKCIYLNREKKLYQIGSYDFCIDCVYAIGRYIAKNGI